MELHAGAARGRSLGVKPCTPAGSTFHTAGEFVAQSSLLLSLSKAEPCPHTGQSMCFAVLIVRKRVSRNRDLSVPFPPAPPHCLTWSPARPDAALRQVPRPSGAPLPHSLSHLGPLLGSQGDGRGHRDVSLHLRSSPWEDKWATSHQGEGSVVSFLGRSEDPQGHLTTAGRLTMQNTREGVIRNMCGFPPKGAAGF